MPKKDYRKQTICGIVNQLENEPIFSGSVGLLPPTFHKGGALAPSKYWSELKLIHYIIPEFDERFLFVELTLIHGLMSGSELIVLGRIIAIANQKGGVGKTTTTVNLSACLAQAGKKVLVVDADPQGNTTSGLGVDKNSLKKSTYTLLMGGSYLDETSVATKIEGLSLIPSNIDLVGAEIELPSREGREFFLKRILMNFNNLYDFIIIDCPPSLSILTINALTAANTVLVPIQCEYYALEGLTQLLRTIELIRADLNKVLEIEGVVFTMFDSRTNLSAQVVDEVKRHMGSSVYKSIIPRNVRLAEAPSHGLPITLYDNKSKGAESYMLLAEEVMEREELY